MSDFLPWIAMAALIVVLLTLAIRFANWAEQRYMPDHPMARRRRQVRKHFPNFNPRN